MNGVLELLIIINTAILMLKYGAWNAKMGNTEINDTMKKIILITFLFFIFDFISNSDMVSNSHEVKGIACKDSNGSCYLLNEKNIYFVDGNWPLNSLWKMVNIKVDMDQEILRSLKILSQEDLKKIIVYKNMHFVGKILYNEKRKGGDSSLEISFGEKKKIKLPINMSYSEMLKYKNKQVNLTATTTIFLNQQDDGSDLLIQRSYNSDNKFFVELSNCIVEPVAGETH